MKRFVLPVMLLLGAAPAFAQSAPTTTDQARQEMIDARVDSLGARLGLDAAGLASFRATVERFGSQSKPLRQDLFATRGALRDELAKAQPDDGKLAQLTDRLASDRQQMQSLEAQKLAELRHQLTPQQYAKLMLARGRFFGRHMHGQHARGGGK
ncbi:MAG: Spy/CpxP family protein refolding chaperone [Polyangia bacterium]